jgi:hypothetical protein
MTTGTLTFPSTDWFEALAEITKNDLGYTKFGRLNAVIAFKQISDEELRDVDIVIEMPTDIWDGMIANIKENGRAVGEWTLNTLDLRLDEEIHKNLMEDGFKADFFFRYNPSLQVFMDNIAKLDS